MSEVPAPPAKHPGGRPLKFKTVEELDKRIDNYFITAQDEHVPFTITGLALALDTSRETLLEYQERPEFVDAIKRAKLRCHNYAEKMLYLGKNAAGPIFNLKNNYGWVDRNETDLTTKGKELPAPILGSLSITDIQADNSDDQTPTS